MSCYLHSPVLHSCLGESLAEAVAAVHSNQAPHTQPFTLNERLLEIPYFALKQQRQPIEHLQRIIEELISHYQADFSDQLLIVASSSLDIMLHEQNTRTKASFSAADSTPLNRIANLLQQQYGFQTSLVINTACSSAANALLYGTYLIKHQLYAGVTILSYEPRSTIVQQGFAALELTSHSGLYRPFHPDSDGLILGEVYAAAMLSNEAKEHSLCRVLGGYSACDTTSVTGTCEDGSHIYAVIQQALNQAGCKAEDIDLVKLHGTATAANDRAERNGTLSFLQQANAPALCTLKQWLGHGLGACGLSETLLLSACLQQGLLPTPRHAYVTDTFALQHNPQWTQSDSLILANFFGFGGNNASLILQTTRQEN